MIINHTGKPFKFAGVTYYVGDKILATNGSLYDGLYGVIKEIRDGEDRVTDNEVPDIHCEFYPPYIPEEIQTIEDRFSKLHGKETKMTDINLSEVVMAPSMIQVLTTVSADRNVPAYLVIEDWAINGEPNSDCRFFLDPHQAFHRVTELLHQDRTTGYIAEWQHNPRFSEEVSSLQYKCWIEDDYFANHYVISISVTSITLTPDTFKMIGDRYLQMVFRNHFMDQVEGWEELDGLSDKQICEMVLSEDVPKQICRQLKESKTFEDAYWESVSEAASKIVKKYCEG